MLHLLQLGLPQRNPCKGLASCACPWAMVCSGAYGCPGRAVDPYRGAARGVGRSHGPAPHQCHGPRPVRVPLDTGLGQLLSFKEQPDVCQPLSFRNGIITEQLPERIPVLLLLNGCYGLDLIVILDVLKKNDLVPGHIGHQALTHKAMPLAPSKTDPRVIIQSSIEVFQIYLLYTQYPIYLFLLILFHHLNTFDKFLLLIPYLPLSKSKNITPAIFTLSSLCIDKTSLLIYL